MMDMYTLRKYTFIGFILSFIFSIVVAVMAKVIGRILGGSEGILIVLKIFVWIKMIINLGLITALAMNFVTLKGEAGAEKERNFVFVSLIALITSIILKSGSGIVARLMLGGGSGTMNLIFPVFNGIGNLLIALTFMISIVFYFLAWFLYGQHRY